MRSNLPRLATVLFFLQLTSGLCVLGQPAAGLVGHWEGGITVQSDQLKIVLDFTKSDDAWKGTIAIPAQGVKDLALEKITVQDSQVSFVMANVPGQPSFNGKISEDGASISGDFLQGGMTVPFQVRRVSEAEQAEARAKAAAKKPDSNWEGTLSAGMQNLRLVLHLFKDPDGSYSATMDSPDQNSYGLEVTTITLAGADLHFELKFIGASFDGKQAADGNSFEGTFQQAGQSFPLTLKRMPL